MRTVTESFADWLPALLQLSDAAFPTGSYAHSYGLEEIVRQGAVRDEDSLWEFLREHFIPALAQIDLPLVRDARAAAITGDREDLVTVDRLAGALRVPRELREASLQTGRRRLAILIRLRQTPELEILNQITMEDPLAGHHAIVWGVSCASIPVTASLAAYYYHSVSCLCTTAPKLIRIGQEGTQRVLTSCLDEAKRCVANGLKVPRDQIGWFDPVLDIASMHHEIACERLFIS
ncbi:MAG TPA: urease accessory UreF family protein [Terrimicrobiaceae bacterium]